MLSYTLVLICPIALAPDQCWPGKADLSFQMSEPEAGNIRPQDAVARRRIDLHGRYILVRNITCSDTAAKVSPLGKGILLGNCRDIGTADGHCPSPLIGGKCPN
jgi:hypothetical protein